MSTCPIIYLAPNGHLSEAIVSAFGRSIMTKRSIRTSSVHITYKFKQELADC